MKDVSRSGIHTFLLVWLGLTVSFTGSQLTGFALGVWLYQRTGSATLNGLVALANVGPTFLASPVAGVLIDRYSRRSALLAAQAGAGACSLAMALLAAFHRLDVGAILLCVALASVC